ncbi:MAG: hypothetical protein Q8O86_08820 [Dehalococcoidia bacterium]|nr:hypothetical protein [Dehalococcoidia bacterium]
MIDRWCEEQLGEPAYRRGARPLIGRLVRQLSLPALIPQVWLAYVYDPYVNPKDVEKTVLRDMPSRVDFLLVKDGERHIVEIDDPSHYAIFDEETRRWEVDEERYTRNLRIEGGLKRQKWFVHRFSNSEVLRSDPMELLALLTEELGVLEDLPF